MTSSCTGMGCTNPISSMALRIPSLTPSSSNVFKINNFLNSGAKVRLSEQKTKFYLSFLVCAQKNRDAPHGESRRIFYFLNYC